MGLNVSTNFVSAEHERMYHEARVLLDNECTRQKSEWDHLTTEFSFYPEQLQKERRAWLLNHFAECRKPYVKLLVDIVSLCPVTTTIKVS
jgi:hypothetical protein